MQIALITRTIGLSSYLIIAYLPLTVFFFILIVLHFNAMSPSVNTIMLLSQFLGSSAIMNILSIGVNFTKSFHHTDDTYLAVVTKVASTLMGMWNLDMFRMLYTPFCLRPNISILQVLSLDYAIAVYPLFLICACPLRAREVARQV